MAVVGLTRAVVRQDVARNLLGEEFYLGTATGNGSTTTIVSTQLRGGDDAHNGKWLVFTSGTNLGTERQVSDYTQSSGTLTFVGAVTSTVTNDTFELFDTRYSATVINRAINRAINSVVGRFYVRDESLALHADGRTARFDIPSTFQMLDRVQYRSQVDSVELHSCDNAWDETVDSDFTITADTEFKKRGNASCKFVIGAGVSNGNFSTDSIASVDLSDKTHVEFWCYAATALAASDLALQLDNTASCVSPVETIVFPAISARTWTFVRLTLANPELDTAVISIGLEYNANSGANTIWLDDLRAVNENRSVYSTLAKNLWSIDPEAQDLVLSQAGKEAAGYNLLKLLGGTHPSAMTTDSTVATVDEDYLIYQATADVLRGGSVSTEEDPGGRRALSDRYQQLADRARGKFRPLVGVRRVA